MTLPRPVLVRVVVAVVLFHAVALLAGLPALGPIGAMSRPDENPGPGEILLLSLLAVSCVPVVLALMGPDAPPTRPATRLTTRHLAGWTGLHLVLVLLTGTLLTGWAPFTDDEDAYLLQARLLLDGQATEAAWLPMDALFNPFVVDVGVRDGVAHWAGCYPLMAGVWTAPGLAVGWPNLLWVPLGAFIVWHGARLAQRLVPDGDAHLAAAVLATSPALIGLSTFKHTSMLATALSLVAARLFLARRGVADVALGAAVGLAVLTRPLDGALVCVAAAAAIAVAERPQGMRAVALRLLRVGVGGVPFAALLVAYDVAVTGEPLVMPYNLLFDGRSVFGFGETAYGWHGPLDAVSNTGLGVLRLGLWGLGWPLALWVLYRALVVAGEGDRRLWGPLALVAAHLALYALAPFGQFSSVGISYAIWLLPLVAVALVALAAGDGRWRMRTAILTGFAWATFVPYGAWILTATMRFNATPLDAADALAAEHGPVLMLHGGLGTRPSRGLIYAPPLGEGPEADVVWWFDDRDPKRRARALAAFPDRPAFTVQWTFGRDAALEIERVR